MIHLVLSFNSSQATGLKNTGWDFSIGGSASTGTVRSAVRPPQARDRKPDVPPNQSTHKKVSDSGNQRSYAPGSMLHTSSEVSVSRGANNLKQEYYDDVWYPYPFLCVCGYRLILYLVSCFYLRIAVIHTAGKEMGLAGVALNGMGWGNILVTPHPFPFYT